MFNIYKQINTNLILNGQLYWPGIIKFFNGLANEESNLLLVEARREILNPSDILINSVSKKFVEVKTNIRVDVATEYTFDMDHFRKKWYEKYFFQEVILTF